MHTFWKVWEPQLKHLTWCFLNFQLIAFRLGDYELSVKHFESVVEEEEDNVNSLQNLAHSYSQLNMQTKSDEMTAIVSSVFGEFFFEIFGNNMY